MKKLLCFLFAIMLLSFTSLKAETKITDPILIHIYTMKMEGGYYFYCPKDGWNTTKTFGDMNVRCKICGQRILPVRI